MRIGVAGPIASDSVSHLLGRRAADAPKGMSGAPLLGTLITALIRRGHTVSAYTLDHTLNRLS